MSFTYVSLGLRIGKEMYVYVRFKMLTASKFHGVSENRLLWIVKPFGLEW